MDENTKHSLDKLAAAGGPAFPLGELDAKGWPMFPGMTLRDHFAGLALTAYMRRITEADMEWPTDEEFEATVSRWSYDLADAMLKARQQ